MAVSHPHGEYIWDIYDNLPVSNLFQQHVKINGYYTKFQAYVITCKNDRTNQLKDRQCEKCGATYRQCNPRSKDRRCYKWCLLGNQCESHDDTKPTTPFSKCRMKGCGGHSIEVCRTLKESTARTYWGVLTPIINAHPLFNEWAVHDLISKNMVGFIKRCQKFYGTVKNAHDINNPSQKRENMIKPSLTRFIEWLRKETGYDRIDEDRTDVETTHCSNCRCGHPECYRLGKYSCHKKMTHVKIVDGDIKIYKQEVCKYGAFRCSCCQQYYAICQYRHWLTRNEGYSMRGCVCNNCSVKSTLSRKSYHKPNVQEKVRYLELQPSPKAGPSDLDKKVIQSTEFIELQRLYIDKQIGEEEYNKRKKLLEAPLRTKEDVKQFEKDQKEQEIQAAKKIHELAEKGIIYEPFLSIHQTWSKMRKDIPKLKRKYCNIVNIGRLKASIQKTVDVLNDVNGSSDRNKEKCNKITKTIVSHNWECDKQLVNVDLDGDYRGGSIAVKMKKRRVSNLLGGLIP